MLATCAPAARGQDADLARIERLYAGRAGDDWGVRNRFAGAHRGPFWRRLVARTGARTLLEVGCNSGANLRHLPPAVRGVGVDVNITALHLLRARTAAAPVVASAAALPFAAATFDLVLTAGLLMHIPAAAFAAVVQELARVSRTWLLLAEYDDTTEREIPWHGCAGATAALWARPFGLLAWQACPALQPVARGQLGRVDGFDDLTWCLFRHAAAAGGARKEGRWLTTP